MMTKATAKNANLKAKHGMAWETDLAALKAACADSPPLEVQVCQYIIEAKYAHPMWSHYLLSCYALRDHAGLPPAIRFAPEATHELVLFALNPDYPIILNKPQSLLHSPNFIGQFSADSDGTAYLVIERTVQEIIKGVLSPDTDFRQQWRQRFLTGESA